MSDKLIHINDEQFEAEVIKSDKPVLVDFWAPWCGPCKMLGPVLEKINDIDIIKVNVDKFVKVDIDENSANAAKYGVMSIPNLVLFKNGEIINRQVGALPKNELKALIENSLN